MAETDILQLIATQPQLLGAILAIVYNIAGWVQNSLQTKKLESYEVAKLAETLVLFEAVFTILQSLAGVPATWTAIIAIAVAVIRSLTAKLKENTATIKALVPSS